MKANPNQGHDIHSVLTDFTAWNVVSGAHLEYTSHYTLRGFDLVGKDPVPFQSSRDGISFGPNTSDMVIADAQISGFDRSGINLFKAFTTGDSSTIHQYKVVDAVITDSAAEYLNYNPALDQILSSDDLPPAGFDVTLDGPLTYREGYPDPEARRVAISGTKTDSLGTTTLPAGTDDFDAGMREVIRILETDGWFQSADGRRWFVLEDYYSDRLTGEIHKLGHLVEIDPNVPLGNQYFSYANARFNGTIDLNATPPVVSGEAEAETGAAADVTIDLLSVAPTASRVDGIVQPQGGRVFDNGDGTVTYRPDFGFTGLDSFKYWVTDGFGNFVPAQATVTVSADAQAPIQEVFGTNDGERMVGTAIADALHGLGGDDTLEGMGGDDLLVGGLGADHLSGGEGTDTANYAMSNGPINIGIYRVGSGGHAQGDTLEEIEHIVGSGFSDTLVGANTQSVTLEGGLGNDLLYDFNQASVLIGGDQFDVIVGNGGDDQLFGGTGADTLFGGAGADLIDGGTGGPDPTERDTASYLGASDAVAMNLATGTGTAGDAAGDTYVGIENLIGGNGDDELIGDDALNHLFGSAGSDTLDGGLGNDYLYGGRMVAGAYDGAQDVFVFSTRDWGRDLILDWEDGIDLIDTRAIGLTFDDFTVVDTPQGIRLDWQNESGQIMAIHLFGTGLRPEDVSAADFLA